MFSFFSKKKATAKVTIATSCWENNWQELLEDNNFLQNIENHLFDFADKILIINNVKNIEKVLQKVTPLLEKGVFTEIVCAENLASEVLSFFSLQRKDFIANDARKEFQVSSDWVFYNALAPLTAIYICKTPYLLYFTSDAKMPYPVRWIDKAIFWMEKNPQYKVANLLWNAKQKEAKKESYTKVGDFFVAKEGFSDQMFLVKTEDFRQKIYTEIREDATHFPRGEVFEKRVFSYMKNHGWLRLTFRKGSYYHQ